MSKRACAQGARLAYVERGRRMPLYDTEAASEQEPRLGVPSRVSDPNFPAT